MGHTSPILGKKLETKILFQTLVSELKKKVFGETNKTKKTIPVCLGLVALPGNKASCLSAIR